MTNSTETLRTLPLLNSDPSPRAGTDAASGAAGGAEGGGCGCGGCGCGTAAAGTSTTETTTAMTETDMITPKTSQGYSRSFAVTGMTCGHCVASVTEELEEIAGVREVNVDLVAGGTSTVTVTSDQPLPDDSVQAAVAEAGYQLA